MFDYLTEQEILEIDTLIMKCDNIKEIMYAVELLAKLHVPAHSLKALIFYKLGEVPTEDIADTVGKLVQLELSSEFATNPQNEKDIYRELFITLGSSIDVIVIKLAIELAYLSLHKMEREDQNVIAVAKLSQDIYAPLCHRLGLGEMKVEFEDLSLYVLDSEQFFDIAKKLQLKKTERELLINEMIDNIKSQIADSVDGYKIFGRSKHIYSIYNKIKKFDKQYEELFDLLAIRIICNTDVECYTVLGQIHQLYPPVDNRFKDYIARPKPNMYQSLHTTVRGEQRQIFEIQIRTFEMDSIAERGVAAHFEYKEGKSNPNDVAKKLTSLKDFISEGDFEADDYKQILAQDILDDHIYALTPARKIIALPIGATVVDFAFKIHSRVGERMVGAKVNGKIAAYSQVLQTNDIVEILTKKNAPGPNETWLDNCVTTHAKSKIKTYLRRKSEIESETKVERGTALLHQELKKRKIDRQIIDDQKKRNEFLRKYKLRSIYDGLEQIADHKLSAGEVVDFFTKEKKANESEIKFVTNIKNKNSVIIPGAEDIKYELAKCCKPVYGDDIVARAKNGVAFKIHRSDCIESGDNNLSAHWNRNSLNENKYSTNLKIVAIDNDKLLNDIINMLSTSNVGVVDFKKTQSNDLVTMIITVSVVDVAHIDVAIANIKKNNLIKTIQRI
ncbi:TGS domain-containing protein [Mollicutes bacterium LVI A0078]|nr:TGS domain-containing protein [Mollicutes bacterium LVI A0075]WOO90293.1 TGS domain-containing protein [Mollicutes bacterium LVI A0078]